MTGKLSDVAGLVVAPPLLAAIVRADHSHSRFVCFFVVALGFVAINVSAPISHAVVDGLGWVGIGWRLWPDPTDLVALSVLPLAWHLGSTEDGRGRRAAALRPAAITLGAIACLATSIDEPYIERPAPILINLTQHDIPYEVWRFEGRYPCGDRTLGLDRPLTSDDFQKEQEGCNWPPHDWHCEELDNGPGPDGETGETYVDVFEWPALNGELRPGGSVRIGPAWSGACGAAWVRVGDQINSVVMWRDPLDECWSDLDATGYEFFACSLSIEGPAHQLVLGLGNRLELSTHQPPSAW